MDRKLLDALNNLSFALEEISNSLNSKDSKKNISSATSTALKSGNIGKQLESINTSVNQLKADNKKILKNQDTLIALSKKKPAEKDPLDKATDPKQKNKLKDGLASIMMIAVGVLAIGLAFKLIGKVNFLSVIALAVALPLVAMAFERIAKMKDLKASQMKNIVIVSVLIATAIMLSSWILQMVKPVGIFQLVTAVFIAGMFGAISFGVGKLLNGLKDADPKQAWKIPIIMVALSLAIAVSSWALQTIIPVGIFKLFTAVFIAATFVVLSYAIKPLLEGLKNVSLKDVGMASLILIALTATVVGASWLLMLMAPVGIGSLFKFLIAGIAISIVGVALGVTAFILSKFGIEAILEGSLSIVVIAGAIALSSIILSMGTYDTYPSFGWALGVGLSLVGFGLAAVVLGVIAMSGVGALAIAAGCGMILLVAATVVATAAIVGAGNYENYPSVGWSTSLAISLGAFGLGALAIGTVIVTTLGIGALALAAGLGAVLMISQTIVEASAILSKGTFTGGPTKDWAEGIALSLGAFTPIYGMMMANSIFSLFGGGGVGPVEFSAAIVTIADGIVTAATKFNSASVAFSGGPKKEWAEGVGLAIGAFAPVYQVLAANSGWFKSGVSVEDMKNAIMTISQGIVDAANFFGENTASFDVRKIPTKEWGDNVGAAIKAFMPALDYISKNDGIFSIGAIKLTSGIISVSKGILASSSILSLGNYSKTIPSDWMNNVSNNVKTYIDLAKYLADSGVSSVGGMLGIVFGMRSLADGYDKLAEGVNKLGTELDKIDTEKLTALKNLTGSIVLMSLMDSDQFESMMDALEDKAKIFVGVMNDMTSSEEVKKGSKGASLGQVKSSQGSTTKAKTMDDLFNVMNSVNQQLSSIARSNDNLSKYVDEIRSSDIDLKRKK